MALNSHDVEANGNNEAKDDLNDDRVTQIIREFTGTALITNPTNFAVIMPSIKI